MTALSRGLRLTTATLSTGSISAARLCSRWGIPATAISSRDGQLWLEPLALPLQVVLERPWLLEGYPSAAALCAAGARLSVRTARDVAIQIGPLTLLPQTAEDLFTLNEVFVRNTYGWASPTPAVVIDIGMNVGFTALALATRAEIVAVHGYEPFASTYALALRNLAENPAWASKVRPHNVGVAGARATQRAEYVAERRGSVGLFGLPPGLRADATVSTESIQLVPASEVVDAVKEAHPGTSIVAKIDCEGAEYQIVTELAATGHLRHLSVLMIEWHRRAPEHWPADLTDQLTCAGFHVFQPEPSTGPTGMLYAARG